MLDYRTSSSPDRPPRPLSERLREETRADHTRAEKHPLMAAMVSGRIDGAGYARYLGQLLHVHLALETQLCRLAAEHRVFGLIVREHHMRTPDLLADLEVLGQCLSKHPPLPATGLFRERIDGLAADAPVGLVGTLYVLEGSTNGGRYIAPAVRRALGLIERGGIASGTEYLDPHGDVLGRDRFGMALRVIDNAVVQRVKRVARNKGIDLEGYQGQVVKTYNNGVEPPGFDFHCGGNMMFELHDYVKKLASFKFDDPEAKIEGGWLNQLVTRGSGYREKGYGPRLHIELAPKENWGNVHIDSHGFVRPDGSYDWHEALTRHGPYDLITGYLGGRVGGAKWTPTGNITYQRDRDHETDVLGLPDGRVPHPADGGPDRKDRGWRLTLGIRLTF
jgi:heme oxygenase